MPCQQGVEPQHMQVYMQFCGFMHWEKRYGTAIRVRVSVLLTRALLEVTPYQITATALVEF